jgi:hypothetical protein
MQNEQPDAPGTQRPIPILLDSHHGNISNAFKIPFR